MARRPFGTMNGAGADAAAHLAAMRELAESQMGQRIGVTQFRKPLIARFIARDALALRKAFAQMWGALRARAGGSPAGATAPVGDLRNF